MRNTQSNLSKGALALFAFVLLAGASAQDYSLRASLADTTLQTNLPALTQAGQIRRLSAQEAGRHYPVKLNGVVLGSAISSDDSFFIADQTAGIYVKGATNRMITGQMVEMEGVSDAGDFAPIVILSNLRATGQGVLPPAPDVSFQRIASGADASQWVRVHGIVRLVSIQRQPDKRDCLVITLAMETGGPLRVLVNNFNGKPDEALIDAEVTVTGVSCAVFNGKRQLITGRLLSPGMKFVEVNRAASQYVLSAPPRPIASLRSFSPEASLGHRVKVQGVALLQQFGSSLFIKDDTQSLWVKTLPSARVAPGDLVEVLGFPASGEHKPELQDAVFRKTGERPPPQPVPITANEALKGDHDADLICVEAQLLNIIRTGDEVSLILQEGKVIFRAQLVLARDATIDLANGALLRVTGVGLTQSEKQSRAQSFRMILRTPADVVVLHQPPWWTQRRMGWALGLLTAVLMGTGIWIATLRRLVKAQTKAIRDKVENEAVLQERMRIARDFHDSLEQELAGIRMQLDLSAATIACSPQTAEDSLQMARAMIRHSVAEARCSIWDLRSQILETNTLPAALGALTGNAENGAVIPIEVKVAGTPRVLSMRVESNLLRIAQEANSNAIKHAKPRRINISLAYENDSVRLKICDDGCGFNPNDANSVKQGHFGLFGMRERADKIGGTLRIESLPGKGTCVEIAVPCTPSETERIVA